MEGISRGVTLGGRYELGRALSSRDDVEQWIATDSTLGREVTVTCFAADHPHGAAALDSARRVAGVEDHRLVRVLDVGSDEDVSYVVEEAVHHASSVAALLREDNLPSEEVRRVIGEAASGLEAARARGLHHLILSPHHVLRARDGSIQVSGVAIGAALEGRDDEQASNASRDDVVALVKVAYAGLTGQWPGPDEAPGVPTAERRADGLLPGPAELVTGVPGDLDTLCRTTLNDDEGPLTPGELARQLSPWSSEQVFGAGGRDQAEQRSASAAQQSRPAAKVAVGSAAAGATVTGAGSRAASYGEEQASGVSAREDEPTMVRAFAGADPDATAVGRPPALDHDATTTYRPMSVPARIDEDDDYDDELEPPLPMLSYGREEPDRDSSRLALGIVAGVVVLALVLGFLGLRSLFSSDSNEDTTAQPGPSVSASASATGPTARPSTSAPTPAAGPIAVQSVSSFDPEGGGNEKDELARFAIDGKPDTKWRTYIYTSDTFGRMKSGVGLMLDLGSAKDVRSVAVSIDGAPSNLTVYVTDVKRLRGAKTLGTISGSGEQTAAASQPIKGRYVIVWITKLSQEQRSAFRDQIAEIKVSS
ncbi:protein kinase family protein [Luteipulveratus sp. YIM 133132]|uniref:protein kinase family protein n=1 Tax=Luteipulveratus flavus TaxID=3031728 RepID=UPI0023AE9208|nr:protein kinase family protein [Luteipulveratus sp. YIM 133132]MDE9365366.1 protein kinase family protein [Luteipulveratus sp. YIM 133132]